MSRLRLDVDFPRAIVEGELPKRPCVAYVSVPYSHRSRRIRNIRALMATLFSCALAGAGISPVSPITQGHAMALFRPGLPFDWKAWQRADLAMLAACDAVFVLNLAGVEESAGVQAELAEAMRLELPVLSVGCERRTAPDGMPEVIFTVTGVPYVQEV